MPIAAPTRTCPNHVRPYPGYIFGVYILSRLPVGTRQLSGEVPRHPQIPLGVDWCRSAMCRLDPKARAVTPKLFRNLGALFAC
jgi:hypothetical protein